MIWIIIAIIVVLVIFVIASYNGLVKSRMQTKEAWSQIDVQLKRRNDLLPNLIETVKGYAKYEGSTLEKVAELRNQVAAATSPAQAMRASDELTRQVSGIFAVAESYPDLKASANFSQLQLLEIRERLGFCFWSFSSCWALLATVSAIFG